MKSLSSLFIMSFGLLMLLLSTACERHPASQTIPGYREKQAAHQEATHRTIGADASNAPTFFPNK